MTRASVREARSMTTFGSSSLSNPAVCEPGEAWQTSSIVPSSPWSRRSHGSPRTRRPPQPGDPLVAERVVRPFGGSTKGVGHAIGRPREGSQIVEVGDGDIGVAADDGGALGLHLAEEVDRTGRIGPVEDEVAGDGDEVRLLRPDGLADGGKRDSIAVDIGEDDRPGHRSTPSLGMMNDSVASQAVSPSTDATP